MMVPDKIQADHEQLLLMALDIWVPLPLANKMLLKNLKNKYENYAQAKGIKGQTRNTTGSQLFLWTIK